MSLYRVQGKYKFYMYITQKDINAPLRTYCRCTYYLNFLYLTCKIGLVGFSTIVYWIIQTVVWRSCWSLYLHYSLETMLSSTMYIVTVILPKLATCRAHTYSNTGTSNVNLHNMINKWIGCMNVTCTLLRETYILLVNEYMHQWLS